ncbi:MAG: DegT/DnrJ/EryC1/StrS family aminotransferase [Patescibacteria group bacterium]
MRYFKPISISLSPNVESDDIKLALSLIIRPWLWKKGKATKELENEFKKYLGVKYAISFNSGRSSLFAILKVLSLPAQAGEVEGLKNGDEIFLQAFTCNAAVNPVLWQGFLPIYVDCDKDNFNIDIKDLNKKIVENHSAKILMIQHTFGMPVNMEEIIYIVRQNNLILIEDCAHSLGAEWNNQKVGTFGNVAFFSFSRDKVISSVYGGMAVTNDDLIAEKLEKMQKEFGRPSYFWIFQQILHPILLNYIILPVYNFFDFGKIFLVLSQWFYILSKAVHWKEKRGLKPDYFPKSLPNVLALLALNQFKKIDKFYQHREEISKFYFENLKENSFSVSNDLSPENLSSKNTKHSFLRFTVKHSKAHEIIYEAWHKQNILLGDWYTTPIAPFDTNLDEMKYGLGTCPNAEELSKKTLNLPTHINISQKDAEKIINFLKKYF